MFPDQTVYTANGDLTTLNAILNAVAMVCQEHATIWGFALVAATWSLVSMTTGAAVGAAGSGAGGELGKRAFGLLIPFCLAIMLTNPGMQSRVTVESGLTGASTTVDHVPALISFVPATASLVSKIVGEKLEAAMQGTGTDYASISASGKGFINPLKTLLTSRTAILRLGGIASEINAVLAACLNADSGADYAQVANHVLFAGNQSGAFAGPPPVQVYAGAGEAPTSIGVLLAEAAQNPSAIVTDIQVGTNHFASCADAAAQVGADIEAALQSDAFRRVVQGAVNAADQPNPQGDYSIAGLAAQYTAIRTANMTTNALAGGVAQANAEVINLLFSELVKNDLDCLRADSGSKSTCLAMAVQGNEIERNNIQQAANGFESLMYAGAFANQITAVVIALGPVIVLFMMFSGVGAGRNMKVAAHMIVWPLLVMNVGAELINGMIYIQVANFMRAIAQDGFINQSTAVEVYKHFSLQVGTASHLMATLPILMTTIFALGESAALVKISDSMGSGTRDESQAVNAPPVNSTPLVTNSSVAKAEQGIGGVDLSLNGAIPAIATSAQFGSLQKEAATSLTSAHQKMQTISEGQTDLQNWTDSTSTGWFRKAGLSESTVKAVREEFSRNYAATQAGKSGHGVSSQKNNFNNSQTSIGASVGAGTSGLGGNLDADHRTNTGASDELQVRRGTEQENAIAKSQALSKALSNVMQGDQYRNSGNEETRALQHSLSVQKQFATTLSESKSVSDVASQAVKRSSGFVALNAQIGGKEVAHQMKTNPEYQRFQLNEGRAFGNLRAAHPYLERARQDMKNGVTDRIVGDEQANEAMARHRAAYLLAIDESAAPETRLLADEYLLGSSTAMLAARLTSAANKTTAQSDIGSPMNRSGVFASTLVKQVDPQKKSSRHGQKRTAPKGSDVASALGSASNFAVEVAEGVEKTAHSVLQDRVANEKAGAEAGLSGSDGPGTNRRTMSNVKANLTGDKTRTELPQKQ